MPGSAPALQNVKAPPGFFSKRLADRTKDEDSMREAMARSHLPKQKLESNDYKGAMAQGLLSEKAAKDLRKHSILNKMIDSDLDKHFEMLLKMQVDMLTNQSPDDPVDPAAMAQNFVAMYTAAITAKNSINVEKNTEMMKKVVALQAPSSLQLYTLVEKDTFQYNGADREIHFGFEKPIFQGQVQIYNPEGKVVFAQNLGAMAPGEHKFTWNGKNTLGEQVPDGTYKVRIVAYDKPVAGDGKHEPIPVSVAMVDPITDYFINEDGEPVFFSGQQKVELDGRVQLSKNPSMPIFRQENFNDPIAGLVDVRA